MTWARALVQRAGVRGLVAATILQTLLASTEQVTAGVMPGVAHGLLAAVLGVTAALLLGLGAGDHPLRIRLAWAIWFVAQAPVASRTALLGAAVVALWPARSQREPSPLAAAAGAALAGSAALAALVAEAGALSRPLLLLAGAGVTALVLGGCRGANTRTHALAAAVLLAGFAALGDFGDRTPAPPARAAVADRPDVFLIVLDTVSAQELGLYGYERKTTPRLAAWLQSRAARPWLHPRAYSGGPWTIPSHGTLFTGLKPREHGLHFGSMLADGQPRAMEMSAPETVAERAVAQGYCTVGTYANRILQLSDGFQRGFDVWHRPLERRPAAGPGGAAVHVAMRLGIGRRLRPYPAAGRVASAFVEAATDCGDAPAFGFVNLMEAHMPYFPRAPHRGEFSPGPDPAGYRKTIATSDPPALRANKRGRHDEELLGLDEELVWFLDDLDAARGLDDSWVVITADHGECFEPGQPSAHGTSLFDPQVRVPLIILPPVGVELPPPAGAVGAADVAATLAALVSGEPMGPGLDLRQPVPADHAAVVEFFGDSRPNSLRTSGPQAALPGHAAVNGSWKLVDQGGRRTAFDLAADPGEAADALDRLPPDVAAALEAALKDGPPEFDRSSGGRELPADTLEALRALGYIE